MPTSTPELRAVKTRRGFTYGYKHLSPQDNKPTLLLIHGFPCTSADWARQIEYFGAKGYGLIVPDILGYGETDAPTELEHYDLHDMSEDFIDILDAADAKKVIAIGHDWGSVLLSRILNKFPERFSAAGFLAVGYTPPMVEWDYQKLVQLAPNIGYWEFLASPEAPALIESHLDSLYSLGFTEDPSIWAEHFAPIGAMEAWIKADKRAPPMPNFDAKAHQQNLLKKGLRGPLNWYAQRVLGVNRDAEIPVEKYAINIPVFFGGAANDIICTAEEGTHFTSTFAPNLKTKVFNSSHWIMAEKPDELNEALEEFFNGL